MNIILKLSAQEIEDCIRSAINNGYMRTNPRKAWNAKERREAITWLATCRLLGRESANSRLKESPC